MLKSYAVNTVGPLLVAKAMHPHMANPSTIVNISARVGSIGDNRLGGWYSYRMSKAALNAGTKTLSHELRRKGISVISLHPGTVRTDLSAPFARNVRKGQLFEVEHAVQKMLTVIDGVEEADSGGFFAYDGSTIEY